MLLLESATGMSAFSSRTIRRIRELIERLHTTHTATVPTKISEMELTAYDYADSDQASTNGASLSGTKEDIMERSTSVTDKAMDCRLELNSPAYIAGDTIKGTVCLKAPKPTALKTVDIKLIGKGMTLYFNAKLRAQKLCEIVVPPISVQEHCVEYDKAWNIPFSIKLDESYPSTMDSGKKGQVIYFIVWEVKFDTETLKEFREVTILAKHSLDVLPRREEMYGDNRAEEEYDMMKLSIYSPASAYLPSEMIQFTAKVQNEGRKAIKKIAVLLLQNVLFFKSPQDFKGRTRSYLMSAKEKSVVIKQYETHEWTDEIQIPDPVPPSAAKFHRIKYELVLVAITKGKKSTIRAVFDQARYHFDIEKYQDDYFRDFLPHACCHLEIGSNHGEKRSASMYGAPVIPPLNETWKSKTKEEKQRRQLPRTMSQPKVPQSPITP